MLARQHKYLEMSFEHNVEQRPEILRNGQMPLTMCLLHMLTLSKRPGPQMSDTVAGDSIR